MSKLQIVVGGQAGSEAKGAVAGYLAAEQKNLLCIRVAGPNAGHSVVHPVTGRKYALRQIPVGAVTNRDAYLAIAAGSEIDPYVLHEEINWLEQEGIPVRDRLFIDPAATWLTQAHKDRETTAALTARIGSTGKGIGAARAARIMRDAVTVGQAEPEFRQFGIVDQVSAIAHSYLTKGATVQIEGTQGYMLGLHTQYYPQVTSSDCTAIDFLAMARVNPWWVAEHELETWVVFRPYPIRVAGNSGPLKDETTWEELGLEPELTTVTKKIRRVGHWDGQVALAAIEANGGGLIRPMLALTMADQIDPALVGVTDQHKLLECAAFNKFLAQFEADCGQPPVMVTTSDRTYVNLI